MPTATSKTKAAPKAPAATKSKAGAVAPAASGFVGSAAVWGELVERGKRFNELCRLGAIGAERKELKFVAKGLGALARRLGKLDAASAGRAFHGHLQALESAHDAIVRHVAALPDPRRKTALFYMADMYVMLRALETSERISGYEQGEDVRRLSELLHAAGLPLSIERVRGVLTRARNRLDDGITERQRWLSEDLIEQAIGRLEPRRSLKS